jgi:hypothetical protein
MPDTNVNMDVAPINVGNQSNFAFQKTVNLAAGGNSPWIILPDEIKSFSVTVSFTGGGTGYVETTTDALETVQSGTGIIGKTWDVGTVGTTTQGAALPCTAVRAVQVNAGTMKMSVRAQ